MRTDLGPPEDPSVLNGLTAPGEPSPREQAAERAVATSLRNAPGAEREDLAPSFDPGQPGYEPSGDRGYGLDDEAGDLGPPVRGRHEDDLEELPDDPAPRRQPQQQPAGEQGQAGVDDFGGVPMHLVHAAEGMGWSQQQARDHIKSVGAERAMADFARYAETIRQQAVNPNDVLSRAGQQFDYAGAGAFPGQPQQQPPGWAQPHQAPANGLPAGHQAPGQPSPQTPEPLFTDADKQALREELGTRAADLMIERMERRHAASQPAQQPAQPQQYQQDDPRLASAYLQLAHTYVDNLAREGGPGMVEFYGSGDPSTWTAAQRTNRAQLLERATSERMVAGWRGQNMPVRQALLRANQTVTAHLAEQKARAAIEGTIERRQRGMTIPPGTPGGGRGARKQTPEQEFTAAVEQIHERYGVAVPAH